MTQLGQIRIKEEIERTQDDITGFTDHIAKIPGRD